MDFFDEKKIVTFGGDSTFLSKKALQITSLLKKTPKKLKT